MGSGHWMNKCDGGEGACVGELGENQIALHGEEGEVKRADPRRDKGEKHEEGNWSGELHVRGNQVTWR